MAILKIAKMGHPALRRQAEAVEDPTAPEIKQLVASMIETMMDAEGLGLAAPQIYVPKRVVVFHVPRKENADDDAEVPPVGLPPLTILVNPEIEVLDEEKVTGWEGCLSVPGLRGEVPRYAHIRYTGWTLAGNRIEQEAEGLHARVVQHECDHLHGVLYPTRMEDFSSFIFLSEWRAYMRAAEEVG
jgi:peptide deformylase